MHSAAEQTENIKPSTNTEAAQLKALVGKEISVRVDEVTCAQEAGQMTDAIVTKWSVVKH